MRYSHQCDSLRCVWERRVQSCSSMWQVAIKMPYYMIRCSTNRGYDGCFGCRRSALRHLSRVCLNFVAFSSKLQRRRASTGLSQEFKILRLKEMCDCSDCCKQLVWYIHDGSAWCIVTWVAYTRVSKDGSRTCIYACICCVCLWTHIDLSVPGKVYVQDTYSFAKSLLKEALQHCAYLSVQARMLEARV